MSFDKNRDADLVIGQPNTSSGACNGDDNVGSRGPTAADKLCLTEFPDGTNVAEQWGRMVFDVDSAGNLFIVDHYNFRVLRYNRPLDAPDSHGAGDGIADQVIGQPDFYSNLPNRGLSGPTMNSIYFLPVQWGGVTTSTSSIWVADRGNGRVLRFPNAPNGNTTTTADLAIPVAVPIQAGVGPDGNLYVIDQSLPKAFQAQILVFTPPFTSTMKSTRAITPLFNGSAYTGPLWDSTSWFESTGFAFNLSYKQATDGIIWVNELSANRTLLMDTLGNVRSIIGARDYKSRGGDSQYGGACGSIDNPSPTSPYLPGWWPGGSIGLDDGNNIYVTDETLYRNHIARYHLPYALSSSSCLPPANGSIGQPNGIGPSKFNEGGGVMVAGTQLIVNDTGRLMVWDNYTTKTFGAPADHFVGQTSGTSRSNPYGIDANSHHEIIALGNGAYQIWLVGNGGFTVFTAPGFAAPQRVVVQWVGQSMGATGPTLDPASVAFRFDDKKSSGTLWLVDGQGSRLLRVPNYSPTNPTLDSQGRIVVFADTVLGQADINTRGCNRGAGVNSTSTSANSFCDPLDAKFDPLGNLYVVDNRWECRADNGNGRVIAFAKADVANIPVGTSPRSSNVSAAHLFNSRADGNFTTRGCDPNATKAPRSPVSIAFKSTGPTTYKLVILSDGYYSDPAARAWHQIYVYDDPLNSQRPNWTVHLPMGGPNEVAVDQSGVLVVRDGTWPRVWAVDPWEQDGSGRYLWLDAVQ